MTSKSSSHRWEELLFTRDGGRITCGLGRRAARPLVVAVVCAALVSATPATAHAETVDDADTVGDMIIYDGHSTPVPERTLNDVSNTALTHDARRVRIKVDYVDLKKQAGGDYQILLVHVVTNQGVRRLLELVAWRGKWSGKSRMYDRRGRTVECSMRHSIDYAANISTMSFPRRCVSRPDWMVFQIESRVESIEGIFGDDGLRDRPTTADDKHLKRSQRVHHK